jgi:hypothetical protein
MNFEFSVRIQNNNFLVLKNIIFSTKQKVWFIEKGVFLGLCSLGIFLPVLFINKLNIS